jgi:hypothetical protein
MSVTDTSVTDTRGAPWLVALAAVAGLALLMACAPDYFPSRGYPLDESWIHAVYGRALARTGSWQYNPGIPTSGSTSPLWSLLLAAPHLLGGSPGTVVLLTKLLGFALHIAAALVLYFALGSATSSSLLRAVGASLVACDPDLVAAAVSGMEIPLAALAACGVLLAARRGGFVTYAVVCATAPWARPEVGVLCFAIPAGLFLQRDRRRLRTTLAAAVCGITVSFGLLALRNLAASGRPLPATFYAKVGRGSASLLTDQWLGFGELLNHLVIADSSVLLALLGLVAVATLVSKEGGDDVAAATAFASALMFFAISFVLVPPVDPGAFDQQRYVLPAVPLLVGAVPQLADRLMRSWLRPAHHAVARLAVLVLLVASVLVGSTTRYPHLANDAHNVDDVQVASGRVLAGAPASDVIWVTAAGAIRYFGNAFTVDLVGVNTPDMLGPNAQAYLDAHPPRYIEIVPGLTSVDKASSQMLEAQHFTPSTPYTVTGFPAMFSQWLVRCPPTLVSGQISIGLRTFHFTCAP